MKNAQFSTSVYLFILLLMSYSCKNNTPSESVEENEKDLTNRQFSYNQNFRPQFHFSPPEKWMNDPNGLVFHKGVYHLFYQYYPEDIVWGPMHWGHAVSKDMIKWEHKPIALFPDEHGDIFSGSAVVDKKNTSGFGSLENPPLVAIFTYHLMAGEKAGRTDFQTQGIAYSLDNGDTWTKFEGNPVITNDGIKDFRDPKVFWHEESEKWIMALVAGDHVKFYSSEDLKAWTHVSDFGKEEGSHGGVWECPDLFQLDVEGSEEKKWALLVSINPGAPNGGSGTQYFVGDFDGTSFSTSQEDVKWLDHGSDNYAGVTYNNLPTDDRLFIGWMSNWNYAQKTPTELWRSAMTLPRVISLKKLNGDYRLTSNVVDSFDDYTAIVEDKKNIELNPDFTLNQASFNHSEIRLTCDGNSDVKMEFKNGKGENVSIFIDPLSKEISIDRRSSGLIDFDPSFADKSHTMKYISSEKLDVRLILDASSLELFINDGIYVMTEQIFPTSPYDELKISSSSNTILHDFKLNKVSSIWE